MLFLPLLVLAHPATLAAASTVVVSSGMSSLQVIYTIAGIMAGIAVLLGGTIKYVWPALKRFGNLLNDWDGEPARPGVPARAGVMERLATDSLKLSNMECDIATIKHEVHLNSGQSIKDIVQRSENKIDELHQRVDAIDKQREDERYDRAQADMQEVTEN